MNKNLDYEIYEELDGQLFSEKDQRKILHTRILKLSAKKSQYSSLEIGMILLESEKFQKSLIQLKRATIIDPKDSFAQANLARALLKLERENEAFSQIKKTLCRYPSSHSAHYTIIRRFQEQGRLEDLDLFYQEIASFLTDLKSIADLYFVSAECLVGSNEYSQAFEMYSRAFKAHPLESRHHYQYAIALYHEGLFEEAIIQFGHARDLKPTDKLSINNIAHLYYCQGRLQKAFEKFEYIMANRLESAGTYSNFILVLYHMDKDEEVIGHYRELLQQNLGSNGPMLQSMYGESLRITQAILARDDIDEETRKFNCKKIEGLNLVLSFVEGK